MRTVKEVGKLYAYFLEAATPFIYTHVHLDMNIRDPGKGMYEDLVQKLGGGNPEKYTEKLRNINISQTCKEPILFLQMEL